MNTLMAEEEEDFMTRGYMVIREAFSAETAARCREEIWKHYILKGNFEHDYTVLPENRVPILREDPTTWPLKVPIGVSFGEDEGEPWRDVFTPKLKTAIDAVCGKDATLPFGCGWWMITFPGYAQGPWEADGTWHIDGQELQRYPFSKEVGLVPVMFFSDVLPNGGGTAVAEGSHIAIAQAMMESGLQGVSNKEVVQTVLCRDHPPFTLVELTGKAGDVVLVHPLLLHARSKNLSPINEQGIRFMCHPAISLKNDLNLQHPVTLLERSIADAILSMDRHSSGEEIGRGDEEEGEKEATGNGAAALALQALTPQACVMYNERQQALLLEQAERQQVAEEEGRDMQSMLGFSTFGSKKARYS